MDQAVLDRVAGTRLGTLWLLLPFAVVAAWAVPYSVGDSGWLASFWVGIGAVALATFAYAWLERRAARRLLRRLASNRGLRREQPEPESFRQYTVVVGMVVLEARFQTRPDPRSRPLVPTLFTALLGWWSLPWGPINTISAIRSNLRGGLLRDEAELLSELRAGAPPRPVWWRRLLALDSGSAAQVAGNLAVLLVLTILAALILFAVVTAHMG